MSQALVVGPAGSGLLLGRVSPDAHPYKILT